MFQYAMLSAYDKTGIVDLARSLVGIGVKLVSSGGTATAIRDAGMEVIDTAELTGYPAILGHRVVTLHPKVHGGILADTSNPEHLAELEEYKIQPFVLVVVNFYPFIEAVASGATREECIEKIDIGGPAMVRGAAKNHAHVGVVTDPADYPLVLEELARDSKLSDKTRRYLARKAFAHTAAYDAAIVAWMDREDEVLLPETLHLSYTKAPLELRYGENPHQAAALYRADGADPWWDHIEQYSGLKLSYLNMYDADAAWRLAHESEFGDKPRAVIVKHANPCGFAIADTLAAAYRLAFECDERSAFGGIVAVNRPINEATVEAMVAAAQADVIIAPSYEPGVVEQLIQRRKNTRILEAPLPTADLRHLRPITGGMLAQEPHRFDSKPESWRVVTKRQPTETEMADAWVAHVLGGFVKSNSIVIVKDKVAWGVGAGQQNRLESGKIAAEKAAGRAQGGASGSDAFYPFPDGIEAAAEAGVAVVVQPGGSTNDDACIAKADELGLAMVFTGERHFLH